MLEINNLIPTTEVSQQDVYEYLKYFGIGSISSLDFRENQA